MWWFLSNDPKSCHVTFLTISTLNQSVIWKNGERDITLLQPPRHLPSWIVIAFASVTKTRRTSFSFAEVRLEKAILREHLKRSELWLIANNHSDVKKSPCIVYILIFSKISYWHFYSSSLSSITPFFCLFPVFSFSSMPSRSSSTSSPSFSVCLDFFPFLPLFLIPSLPSSSSSSSSSAFLDLFP